MANVRSSFWAMDRRRERAISQRESHNYAIEIRRAARLIDAELLRARGAARMVIKDKRWWIPDTKLKTDAWQTYSAIIAPVLSYADWVLVMKVVLAIHDLSLDRLTGELSDTTVKNLVPMLNDIEAGVQALTPYVLDDLPLGKSSM